MSESKLFDFMNVELPEPKRSNVPWRFVNRFTASPGYINVSAVIEVLPTDRWTGNLHSILRSRPTISSIYGGFRESHQAFFVPARLYSKTLDQLQTFGATGFDPNANISLPKISFEASDDLTMEDLNIPSKFDGVNLPCSLLSQLRMFPSMYSFRDLVISLTNPSLNGGKTSIEFNAIPLVGYYDILRNYYFNDQELEMPFVVNEFINGVFYDGPTGSDVQVSYRTVSRDALDNFVHTVYESSDDPLRYVSPPFKLVSTDYNGPEDVYFVGSFSEYLDFIKNLDFSTSESASESAANHLGLGVRTYDDDYFTVSLNNEYVDELNNTARVVVSNGSFSVTQMQRANRLHKHVSRNVLRGSDYEDYLYVHFNAKLGREFNKPIFLGSVSNNFYFEDIYSTVATSMNENAIENNSLGTRAGVLNSRMSSNDGFIDFTANEYGFIMVLSSIIPNVSYSNNTPRMYLKTGTADLYSPEFDAWSFQDVFRAELYTVPYLFSEESVDSSVSVADQYQVVSKSQPAWFEHLAPYDYVGGLFATDLQYGFQTLTRHNSYRRDYLILGYSYEDSIQSTYIRPWEWNYIFQYQAPWFDNFEWQIMFDFNAYRPISKQILPSM